MDRLPQNFKFYKPCDALQPFVRYHWAFQSKQVLNALTFPIGCPQIIFHRKTPLYIPELKASQPRLTISGQVNYPAHLYSNGDTEMIVTVFQPHALKVFLPIPLSALHNQEIAGYDLNLPKLNELAARVLECADTSLCICMIEEWLLSQMAETYHSKKEYDFKRMKAAIQQILNHPETPVARLASITCLSSKQFERLFNDNVGANPKEYIRIVRFQKSLGILQNSPKGISHAQLADLCGYEDNVFFILSVSKQLLYFCTNLNEKDKTHERSKSKRNDPRLCIRDVDECAHAHAHLFQNAGCKPSHPDKQTEESEIQHADVLAHRTGSQQYQGILYAPRRQKAHTI